MKKIFVIHGWTYTTEAWNKCFESLRAKGIEPVMLKVPGLTEPSSEVWTLPLYVKWLEEKLAGESDAIVVGHSNGGRIALAYLAAHANNTSKISKLILIDSAGLVRRNLPARIKRFVFGGVARTAKKVIGFDFARKVFYHLIRAKDYERAPLNMRETMKNLIVVDLREALSLVLVPTLIIWGKKDKETPLSDGVFMHEHIAGSKLVVMDNARHSPHLTHPEEVAEEIASFAF